MLEINPYQSHHLQIFLPIHSMGCLFVSFIVYFAVQKLLSLIGFHLFIFAFILFALGDRAKEILLQFMSKSVLPMFFSRSFLISCLIFRSLIHFNFIFVYDFRECSDLILFHVAVQFSQHHILKKLGFLYSYPLL